MAELNGLQEIAYSISSGLLTLLVDPMLNNSTALTIYFTKIDIVVEQIKIIQKLN